MSDPDCSLDSHCDARKSQDILTSKSARHALAREIDRTTKRVVYGNLKQFTSTGSKGKRLWQAGTDNARLQYWGISGAAGATVPFMVEVVDIGIHSRCRTDQFRRLSSRRR